MRRRLRQDVAGHTTYRLAEEPTLVAPWTYADARPGGTFERVGGGGFNTETGYWNQGAYNADDIARAAVVYLRHWQLTGVRREPADSVRAAAHDRVPADRRGAERGQRGPVDAGGRDADAVGDTGRASGPVGLRTELLARAHHLGARRGLRRVRGRIARIRRLPRAAPRAVGRRPQPSGARALRRVGRLGRHAGAGMADRRWSGCLGRGGARTRGPGRVEARRRRRGDRTPPARGGHRGDVRRRRAIVAVRSDPAVGAVAQHVARVGLADAGGAGRGIRRPWRQLSRGARRPRLGSLHARRC